MIHIYQVKRTLRGKYVVFVNKQPINYKIFYQKSIYYGLIKSKENIVRELRNKFEERARAKIASSQNIISNDMKKHTN